MEWIGVGVAAFILLICHASYPKKIRQLETAVKKLDKKQRGENGMSKLIHELVGKECKIKSEDALQLVDSTEFQCFVLDTDDEWMKIRYTDKKKNQIVKLLRIETVDEIEVTQE